jgi:hypothetical protein
MVSGRTKAHELARRLPWARKAERLVAAVDPEHCDDRAAPAPNLPPKAMDR